MDTQIDQYRDWLGIEEPRRPLSYYQLLGLQPFESDTVVIDLAADQQILAVGEFTNGPHSRLARRTLFELESAKKCLLDTASKRAYDEWLRTGVVAAPSLDAHVVGDASAATAPRQSAQVPRPVSAVSPPTVEPLTLPAMTLTTLAPIPRLNVPAKTARLLRNLWIAAGATGLVLVGVVVIESLTDGPAVTSREDSQRANPSTDRHAIAKQPTTGQGTNLTSPTTASPVVAPTASVASFNVTSSDPPFTTGLSHVKQATPPAKHTTRDTTPADSELNPNRATPAPSTTQSTPPVPNGGREGQLGVPTGPWDHLDLKQAKMMDDFVRIPKGEHEVSTKERYADGIDIVVVARTEKDSIRIYGPRGSSVIFNWENKPNELRVTRPDGGDGIESGSLAMVAVQPLVLNRWYTLRWQITKQGMEISVNGKNVFKERRTTDLSSSRAIRIHACGSDVDVKSFVVTAAPDGSPGNSKEKELPASQSAEETQKKAAVPAAADQAETTRLVKEVYGGELSDAKTADQKTALAKKLLQKAHASESDRSAQFVLLRLARDIAVEASNDQTAFAVIDEMDKAFQIDVLEMKVTVLTTSPATTTEQHKALSEKAAEVVDEAIAKDNFTIAKQLNELAIGEAKKSKDAMLVTQASERKTEIDDCAKEFESVKAAMATLEKMAADPQANLTVGKYQCFVKSDWGNGLLLLSLGSDKPLKALAAKEIEGVVSSDEQAKLGDGWWIIAETQIGTAKKQIQGRASYWYQKALPGLTGLTKDKVEGRLRKLQEHLPTFLADLEAEEVRVHHNYHEDPSIEVQTCFKGKSSPHTLWAHPPGDNSSSHIVYQLDSRFRTLRGDAGIGDGARDRTASPLTFRIVGDGKILWRSQPLKATGVSISFRVNVTKVKKLELFVDCPGSYSFAWGLWIVPILQR